MCQEAGVAVVYSLSLTKVPISGAARWVGGIPLIQITDRHRTNEHFWSTFYHAAGHILLHGKKDVFIEGFEGAEMDEQKEEEANNFARDYILPDSFLSEIGSRPIDEKLVSETAVKYETHPGIVVGRLQQLRKVPASFGNDLKSQVRLGNFMK